MSKKTGLPKYVRLTRGALYYQRPDRFGGKMKRIKAEIGTAEFWQAYSNLEDRREPPADPKKSSRGLANSFRAVADIYFELEGSKLDPLVYRHKELALQAFCEHIEPTDVTRTKLGHWGIADFEEPDITRYLNLIEKAHGTGRANYHLSHVRPLFRWACRKGWRKSISPCYGMKDLLYKDASGKTILPHVWTEVQLQAFRDFWPIGTKPRLAFDLIYWTWIRRSDVVRLGPDHIKTGLLRFCEHKGRGSEEPKNHVWPIPPELKESIDRYLATYQRHEVQDVRCRGVFLTYVGNGQQKAGLRGRRELPYFDSKGRTRWFSKHFAEWVAAVVDKDGNRLLPDECTPHGIRRAAPTEAVHRGDDPHAIRAQLGHTTLAQTMKYIKTANDDLLVAERMAKRQRQPVKLKSVRTDGGSSS